MFWRNFKYQLKILTRDRALIFWTLAFPLILGTFFCLAFSNIESNEQLAVFDIAVVETEAPTSAAESRESITRQALEALSVEGDDQLFRLQKVNADGAEQLLADEEIIAAVKFVDGNAQIVAHTSGIEVTILKAVLEQINDQINTFGRPRTELIEVQDNSRGHLSYTMIEFYSLIAMTCLYSSMLGMSAVNRLLANMSVSGRRIAVSPTSKYRLLLGALLASFLVQLVGLVVLFVYTSFVLKVDYGEHYGMVVLLSLAGSLCGLGIGAMVASVLHTSENTKVGLIIAVTMFGCFLSGMMGITMKYIVDTNLPFVNQINPANLITDGFYALYYYGVGSRFWVDVASLAFITLVINAVAVFGLRREQYDCL